jgi:Saxitoxin biosynthesis operon protein SxtJ
MGWRPPLYANSEQRGYMMDTAKAYAEIDPGSDRNFGITIAFILALSGIWPYLRHGEGLRVSLLILACLLLLIAFIKPRLLHCPNLYWHKFGLLLGRITTPVIMTLLYCSVILPAGLMMRFLGKDSLKLKPQKNSVTYWIKREPLGSLRNQF